VATLGFECGSQTVDVGGFTRTVDAFETDEQACIFHSLLFCLRSITVQMRLVLQMRGVGND
jgi:hypothetical protein